MNGTFTHFSLPVNGPGSTMHDPPSHVVRRQLETVSITRMLQRFTQIRRDEIAPVLVSALAFFFVLTALTAAKPAGGGEVKATNSLVAVPQQQPLRPGVNRT